MRVCPPSSSGALQVLIEQKAQAHRDANGRIYPKRIEGAVRREVEQAPADMLKASEGVVGGWTRRTMSFLLSAIAT